MKINIYIICFFISILTSCSLDEVVDSNEHKIENTNDTVVLKVNSSNIFARSAVVAKRVSEFTDNVYIEESPIEDVSTYSSVLTDGDMHTNGSQMACFALSSGTNAFDFANVTSYTSLINPLSYKTVSYNSGTSSYVWDAEPLYWPNSNTEKISLFSAAPASNVKWFEVSTGSVRVSSTVVSDPSQQKDIIAAETYDKSHPDGSVLLDFKHVLSKIGFKACCADGCEVQIDSMSIVYTLNTFNGTAVYDFATDSGYSQAGTQLSGMYNIPLRSEVSTSSFSNTYSNPIQINADNGFLFIAPQDLSANEKIMTLKLYYKYTENSTESICVTDIQLCGADFKSGKQYYYIFKIEKGGYVIPGLVLYLDGYDAPVNGEWVDRSSSKNNAILGGLNGMTPVYDEINHKYDFTQNPTETTFKPYGVAANVWMDLNKSLNITKDATLEMVVYTPSGHQNVVFHASNEQAYGDCRNLQVHFRLNDNERVYFDSYNTKNSYQRIYDNFKSSEFSNFHTFYFKKSTTDGQFMGYDGAQVIGASSQKKALGGPIQYCTIGASVVHTWPFHGYIKCIRVYNRALTQDELQYNFDIDYKRFASGISNE